MEKTIETATPLAELTEHQALAAALMAIHQLPDDNIFELEDGNLVTIAAVAAKLSTMAEKRKPKSKKVSEADRAMMKAVIKVMQVHPEAPVTVAHIRGQLEREATSSKVAAIMRKLVAAEQVKIFDTTPKTYMLA